MLGQTVLGPNFEKQLLRPQSPIELTHLSTVCVEWRLHALLKEQFTLV